MTPQNGQRKMMIHLLTSDLTPHGEALTTASCFLNNKQSLKREQQEGFCPGIPPPPQVPYSQNLSILQGPGEMTPPLWSLTWCPSWIASLLALVSDCMSPVSLR